MFVTKKIQLLVMEDIRSIFADSVTYTENYPGL